MNLAMRNLVIETANGIADKTIGLKTDLPLCNRTIPRNETLCDSCPARGENPWPAYCSISFNSRNDALLSLADILTRPKDTR